MKNISKLLGLIFLVIIAISLPILSWYVGRKINYSLMYRNLVKETIREMVKPEALK